MSLLPRTEDILEKITKSLETWKKVIVEVHENDENRKNQLSHLKNHVQSYSQLEQEYEQTNRALQTLDEKLNSSTQCEDVNHLYTECYNDLATSSNSKHENSRVWQAVFRGISDVREIRKKTKKIDDLEYEEVDESLLCSNVFIPPLDPISKVTIKNPYKNKKCGHIYEHDTITDYIKHMKQRAKCPYIGCNNDKLKMTELVEDTSLRTKIRQYIESQTGTEDEEEDDDY